MVRFASFAPIACAPLNDGLSSGAPSGLFTSWTACAECRTPLAASVAYAFAISRGVTPWEPSVMEQTACSRDVMPMSWAVMTTFEGFTTVISCAKIVFTECAVASRSVMVPADSSA